MDSTIQAPIMWGRSNYPFPGKFLGTGNRCGHNPDKPAWDLFKVPTTKKDVPHVMRKLLDGIKDYYSRPTMLPTLSNLNGKQNHDGQPRLNRSEAREAECLVMAAILHLTEYSTLRVGTPLPNGDFVPRSCGEIAKVAGLIDPDSDPEKPEPSQRFWRAFRRLKVAGAFDVHRQYEIKEDGSKRARPAIKNLNFHFLVAIGRVGYEALKKFRTWCSNKLKKARSNHRVNHPEQYDAETAKSKLRMKQALGGLNTFKPKKKRPKAIPDNDATNEMKRQYNLEMAAYMAELDKQKAGKPDGWLFAEVRKKYPPFDQWMKTKQV